MLLTTCYLCKDTYNIIANCTLLCNNSIRDNDDLNKLHNLHLLYKLGGSSLIQSNIVIKGRMFIMEGEIKRHHKHSGIKTHMLHLFSDVMIISSVSGKGLKLEYIVPLFRDSGTMCLPLFYTPLPVNIEREYQAISTTTNPTSSNTNVSQGCWFLLLSKNIMYLCAKNTTERDKWVTTINTILSQNKADHDVTMSKTQITLTNTIINEINNLTNPCKSDSIPTTTTNSTTADVTSSCSNNHSMDDIEDKRIISFIQINWCNLLYVLEEKIKLINNIHTTTTTSTTTNSSSNSNIMNIAHLRSVIEQHNIDTINKIISLMDTKKIGPLITLLTTNKIKHYYIASGWFYNGGYTKSGSVSFNATYMSNDFIRPTLLKVYLLNNYFITTVVTGNYGKLSTYYYHIDCNQLDYRDGNNIHPLAIIIIDNSIKINKSLLSNIFQSDKNRERILIASCIEQKLSWMVLLSEIIKYNNNINTSIWQQAITDTNPIECLNHFQLGKVTINNTSSYGSTTWVRDVHVRNVNENELL
jgi:hypothetical protein